MDSQQLNTPVLFLMYNRPDFALKIFSKIRKVKPKRLYISIDGAKNSDDFLNVEECRKIENLIDWPCEIYRNYNNKNLGCKNAVSSGISWFFNHEKYGIILEDDCLPETSFFSYCEELLKYYEHDNSVGHISGSNFLESRNIESSYYFSNYSYSWGWATWRRAWKMYDKEMLDLPEKLNEKLYAKLNLSLKEIAYWNTRLIKTYVNKIDTWDYQWLYALWVNNLKSIVPTNNLISNIGFDLRATHTIYVNNNISKKQTKPLTFIVHNSNSNVNSKNDKSSFNNAINLSLYKIFSFYIKTKLVLLILRIKNKYTSKKFDFTWAFHLF